MAKTVYWFRRQRTLIPSYLHSRVTSSTALASHRTHYLFESPGHQNSALKSNQ